MIAYSPNVTFGVERNIYIQSIVYFQNGSIPIVKLNPAFFSWSKHKLGEFVTIHNNCIASLQPDTSKNCLIQIKDWWHSNNIYTEKAPKMNQGPNIIWFFFA